MGRFVNATMAGAVLVGLTACGTTQVPTAPVTVPGQLSLAPATLNGDSFSTQYYIRPRYANFFGYGSLYSPFSYGYGFGYPYFGGYGYGLGFGYPYFNSWWW